MSLADDYERRAREAEQSAERVTDLVAKQIYRQLADKLHQAARLERLNEERNTPKEVSE